jgi:hypothetical protein
LGSSFDATTIEFSPDCSENPFGHFGFVSFLQLGFCPKDCSEKRE